MTKLANEAGTTQFPLIKHSEQIGWTCVSQGEALHRRGGEGGLFFYRDLEDALLRLNPGLSLDGAKDVIQRLEGLPSTLDGNREVLEWLRGNRSIYDDNEKRNRNVTVIDFDSLDRNVFHVTYEWTFRAGNKKGNRADIVFLVNGIPLAIVENKNPKLPDAMERAIVQLRRYELETPELLSAAQVFNVTHLIEYFYGVTWNYSRKGIFRWKEEASESYKQAVQSFFNRATFLQMVREWILFYLKDDELQKTILRQHQTRAAVKVVDRCADPVKKTGLVWHTQGSGKTFTLLTAARLILEDRDRFPGATVMLVVDRNELQGQLSAWVERLLGEMQGRQIKVEYADSRARLQELLDGDFRGLIISMIHKFETIRKDSSTRSDFFVLIDEAHRSVGGDLGNYLMGALPNATLIGFTGTPIDKTVYGKGTFKTFGTEDDHGYLDKYSIRESIADGTTLKLRHALAPSGIRLPEGILESEFLRITEAEGVSDVDELNRILDRAVTLRAFLKAPDRVDKVARFVAKHFIDNVEPLGYKAFLVAVDREACALYKKALDKYLPPEYSAPVYTKSAADVVDKPLIAELQLSDEAEKGARKDFPKAARFPKILIVTDKLLTGFDAPILYAMYLDKPMRDHVLLQAIARVNRPYEDETGVKKPCGIIIDFVGVLKELNKALAFDSDDVNGLIEDLDVLLNRFHELMQSLGKHYLDLAGRGPGGNDEKLDRLLYQTFLEKEERQRYVEFFKEIETLYEILSPSPELRDYIGDYNKLIDLYVMLRNAYGKKTTFIGDIAHKTERLLREHASVDGLERLSGHIEFDAEALKTLGERGTPDSGKVINLAVMLSESKTRDGKHDPVLLGIAERADAVLEAFTDRQTSTSSALKDLKSLMEERKALDAERKKSGLDPRTFFIFWALKRAEISAARELAIEIDAAFKRFGNYESSADEMRQLKAEIYKTLLRETKGKKMLEIAEEILRGSRT